MASELRKIEFNLVETHAALEIFGFKTGAIVPKTPVTKISPAAMGRIQVIFNDDELNPLNIGEKDLMAALLIFCRQKGIPVPKTGKKMLKPEGKKVTLMVKMT